MTHANKNPTSFQWEHQCKWIVTLITKIVFDCSKAGYICKKGQGCRNLEHLTILRMPYTSIIIAASKVCGLDLQLRSIAESGEKGSFCLGCLKKCAECKTHDSKRLWKCINLEMLASKKLGSINVVKVAPKNIAEQNSALQKGCGMKIQRLMY